MKSLKNLTWRERKLQERFQQVQNLGLGVQKRNKKNRNNNNRVVHGVQEKRHRQSSFKPVRNKMVFNFIPLMAMNELRF